MIRMSRHCLTRCGEPWISLADGVIMYKGVFSIYARYWRAYGGTAALVRSFYLHAALLITLICANAWLTPGWWDQVTAILPNVLGFTLGGFAIFISFGDEKFRQLLAEPDDEDDEDAPTAYVRLCSTFVHFILVQILALLFAIIAKAMYFPWVDAPAFFKAALPWVNGAAGFIGYALFIYSLTSALAATMHVFRIASMYESFQKNQAKADENPK